MSPPPSADDASGTPTPEPLPPSRFLPTLSFGEWLVFAILAGVIAATNIYSTLLIGWGDTGSIIAVLAATLMLGVISKNKPSVHTLNLGQTMVSAGGSVGFAVASYAAVHILEPDWDPSWPMLMTLFAGMGTLGAIIGSTVRKSMVRYFFPSGTACAVIQKAVTKEPAPGERNRPLFMLKLWGSIAALLTIPTKISTREDGSAMVSDVTFSNGVGLGVDPLYYGIGIVVGPRVGIGMLLGALATPFWITPALEGTVHEAATGDWVRWIAIAVLTLPTFATIVYAYLFRTPPVIPPGFTPGATGYTPPTNRTSFMAFLGVIAALVVGYCAESIFGIPWQATIVTMAIAWPMCIVNGRVTGDTDINPVRLVAVVILSGFFWLIDSGATTLLGMAVVGGTLAAVAVDMMQDYRTGYLVDADPVQQTTVQFFGTVVGAIVSVPVLVLLLGELGIGMGSSLPAPGAQVWAAMADTMTGGFEPSDQLIQAVLAVSVVGSAYAYLTVWPKTSRWMPSIFGMGIGMLVGIAPSAAIFVGGLIKGVVSFFYTSGKTGEARIDAAQEAGNDTMLAGASIFAAGAVLAILLVMSTKLLDVFGLDWFTIAH